ncbi:unnamed protein product [Dovyalis caffra]|uniref:Disease resistance protein n=1 Tax=Dovyalis caffra TaxID=77055 RepID=A0AAV1SU11_9ROSI|nr:unnamed protein product [Dovyalis caffra]
MTFLLDKLVTLLENELRVVERRWEEIVYVKGELERIRDFLRVTDTLAKSDEEVEVWVKQIRDVAHETKDQDRREDAVLLDMIDLVRIEEHKSKLVGWLINGDSRHEVVLLARMGGLGKTTLEKQVYDDA